MSAQGQRLTIRARPSHDRFTPLSRRERSLVLPSAMGQQRSHSTQTNLIGAQLTIPALLGGTFRPGTFRRLRQRIIKATMKPSPAAITID